MHKMFLTGNKKIRILFYGTKKRKLTFIIHIYFSVCKNKNMETNNETKQMNLREHVSNQGKNKS